MRRVTALLVVLLLGLSLPALASAQLGPTNIPAPLTTPDPSQQPQTPFEQDTGLSTLQIVLIFGAAIGLIAVISWFIVRDAHSAAPANERGASTATSAGAPRAPGEPKNKSARERERERARKRNKAKAARNQRKRNRSR